MTGGRKKRSNKSGSFLPALCSIIGTAILLGVIVLLIPMSTPRLFGYDMYNVVSESMEPAIPKGSLLFVQFVDCAEIEENEVIAFYSNGSVVAHRVTSNNSFEGKLTTKGDANADDDLHSVLYKEVIGRVKWHIPILGDISSQMMTAFGRVYVLALIILGLLFHVLSVRLRDLLE